MAKAELGGVEVKKKRYLVMTVAAVLIMLAFGGGRAGSAMRQTAKLRETRPERK